MQWNGNDSANCQSLAAAGRSMPSCIESRVSLRPRLVVRPTLPSLFSPHASVAECKVSADSINEAKVRRTQIQAEW